MEKKTTEEDLLTSEKNKTTIEGINMYAKDWVEQAASQTKAVSGNTYVKLNRGILTVEQIDALLDSIPLEFSYIDDQNQFIYYNNEKAPEEMLAPSYPNSVGNPLHTLHPEKISTYVSKIVQQLRNKEKEVVRIGHPLNNGEKYVVHNYQRIQDQYGNYLGINEYVADVKPIIDWYLEQTGQKLVEDDVDSVSSASKNQSMFSDDDVADSISSASLQK